MRECLTYDDVLLEPQYSEIKSRNDVSLHAELGLSVPWLKAPIIAAPMDTVCEDDMAIAINRLGGMGIIHRYNTIEQQVKLVKQVKDLGCAVGAAVGTTGDFFERAQELKKIGVDFICIDIAHAHHITMKEALKKIRYEYPKLHIMAGNVATA